MLAPSAKKGESCQGGYLRKLGIGFLTMPSGCSCLSSTIAEKERRTPRSVEWTFAEVDHRKRRLCVYLYVGMLSLTKKGEPPFEGAFLL